MHAFKSKYKSNAHFLSYLETNPGQIGQIGYMGHSI